jgi:hypothetical protein
MNSNIEVDIPGCYNINDGTHTFFAPIFHDIEENEIFLFHKGNYLGVGNDETTKDDVSVLLPEYLINYHIGEDDVGISIFTSSFNVKNYYVDADSLDVVENEEDIFSYRYNFYGEIIRGNEIGTIFQEPIVPFTVSPSDVVSLAPIQYATNVNSAYVVSTSGFASSPYSKKEFLYQFGTIPKIIVNYIPAFVFPSWGIFGYSLTGLSAGMEYDELLRETSTLDTRGLVVNASYSLISNVSENPSANYSDFSAQSIYTTFVSYLFGALISHISMRKGFNFALRYIPSESDTFYGAPALLREDKYPERFRRIDLNYYLIYDRENDISYFGKFHIDYSEISKYEELYNSGKLQFPQLGEISKDNALVFISSNRDKLIESFEKFPATLPTFNSHSYEVIDSFKGEIPIALAVEEKDSIGELKNSPYLIMVITFKKPDLLNLSEPYYKRTLFNLLKTSDEYISKQSLYRYLRNYGSEYYLRVYLVEPDEKRITLVYEKSNFIKGVIFPKFLATTQSRNSFQFKVNFGSEIIYFSKNGNDVIEKAIFLKEPISFIDSSEGLEYPFTLIRQFFEMKEGE